MTTTTSTKVTVTTSEMLDAILTGIRADKMEVVLPQYDEPLKAVIETAKEEMLEVNHEVSETEINAIEGFINFGIEANLFRRNAVKPIQKAFASWKSNYIEEVIDVEVTAPELEINAPNYDALIHTFSAKADTVFAAVYKVARELELKVKTGIGFSAKGENQFTTLDYMSTGGKADDILRTIRGLLKEEGFSSVKKIISSAKKLSNLVLENEVAFGETAVAQAVKLQDRVDELKEERIANEKPGLFADIKTATRTLLMDLPKELVNTPSEVKAEMVKTNRRIARRTAMAPNMFKAIFAW